ncbi:MAG: hypothetical protein KDI75_06465 [Xanthomonadales bacterium]|nr:hypothetical protein [Xanthomonadales bacterium]
MRNFKRTLLALACGVAISGPTAAYNFNESLDGSWTDSSAIGTNKGVLIDYVPSLNLVFFAFFTYAADGTPVWLSTSFVADPGADSYTGIAVATFEGGEFDAAGSPAAVDMGTVDINFACNSIQMTFHPAAGSGLNVASFNLAPSLGLDSQNASECAVPMNSCPQGTIAMGEDCKLPNSIAGDQYLPYGKKYIVEGKVSVEAGGRLTVAPGVTVQGSTSSAQPNFILVNPDAQIFAVGTPDLPITFTGPEAFPGSWAGLVLAGRSTCNDAAGIELGCAFEADSDINYGGDVLDDNSGRLRYVRILWAGQLVNPDEELNSLTLLGVGSGTEIDHVQVDGGLDDGIEFFGGSVNATHVVCSNMGDDCLDFDQGYTGKIQHALIYQGINTDAGDDSNGIEADNDRSNNDKEPRTSPTVSNVTLVGGPVGNEAIRLRRGMGGYFHNIVATDFRDTCLNLDDAGTFGQGTAAAQGTLQINNSFMGQCDNGTFEDDGGDPYAVSAWYNAGTGNGQGDPMLDGFLPQAGSPVLTGGMSPSDPFFVPTTYRGAFSGPNDNWTAGWTVNLP